MATQNRTAARRAQQPDTRAVVVARLVVWTLVLLGLGCGSTESFYGGEVRFQFDPLNGQLPAASFVVQPEDAEDGLLYWRRSRGETSVNLEMPPTQLGEPVELGCNVELERFRLRANFFDEAGGADAEWRLRAITIEFDHQDFSPENWGTNDDPRGVRVTSGGSSAPDAEISVGEAGAGEVSAAGSLVATGGGYSCPPEDDGNPNSNGSSPLPLVITVSWEFGEGPDDTRIWPLEDPPALGIFVPNAG